LRAPDNDSRQSLMKEFVRDLIGVAGTLKAKKLRR
jgi:hypothetical protein